MSVRAAGEMKKRAATTDGERFAGETADGGERSCD